MKFCVLSGNPKFRGKYGRKAKSQGYTLRSLESVVSPGRLNERSSYDAFTKGTMHPSASTSMLDVEKVGGSLNSSDDSKRKRTTSEPTPMDESGFERPESPEAEEEGVDEEDKKGKKKTKGGKHKGSKRYVTLFLI